MVGGRVTSSAFFVVVFRFLSEIKLHKILVMSHKISLKSHNSEIKLHKIFSKCNLI